MYVIRIYNDGVDIWAKSLCSYVLKILSTYIICS